MPQLQEAAEQFHKWMPEYSKKIGYEVNHNEVLVAFLSYSTGFHYVKTFEELCELAVLVQRHGYKTKNPPCTSTQFGQAIEAAERGHLYSFDYGDTKPVFPEGYLLIKAAEQFHFWMKKKIGYDVDNNQELVEFLYNGIGFRYIKTFEEFCHLAEFVQKKYSYKTTNPPCTSIRFGEVVEAALDRAQEYPQCFAFNPYYYGKTKPVIPKGYPLEKAGKEFDWWMQDMPTVHERHGHNVDNNKALVAFLIHKRGFRYIKTFEEFCHLAEFVQKKYRYNTTNPPCTPTQFNEAIVTVMSFAQSYRSYRYEYGDTKPLMSKIAQKETASAASYKGTDSPGASKDFTLLSFFGGREEHKGSVAGGSCTTSSASSPG